MNKTNWILHVGTAKVDCTSFPYAFRSMYNMIRKGIENKRPVDTSTLAISGPENIQGDRKKYSYSAATQMATDTGLLLPDGTINSKEFKKKY